MENKTGKYFKYAIGEIVLVVIGILIALQINNWNEERVQSLELDGLLQSISSSVQSDIRELNLLVTARTNIGEKSDKIFKDLINSKTDSISLEKVTYVAIAMQDINNIVYFRSNFSAYESLSSSTYNRKIQNTDLSSLLSAYYINAEKIKDEEQQYNESLEKRNQEWFTKFRNNPEDQEVFLRPWNVYDNFASNERRYLEVLRDISTRNVLGLGFYEPYMIDNYEEQILMGNAIVKMIKNSQTSFDEETKLKFSGILYSFANAEIISILINGKLPTGFTMKYAASGILNDYITEKDDYINIEYPEKTYDWFSPYFEVNALDGRVNDMDFSGYTKLILEMKGTIGGEKFSITIKDKDDPTDGSESRVNIELTEYWKTYEIETSKFQTADMKTIMVPLALIFEGVTGRSIQIRSVQFKKDLELNDNQ